MDFYDFFKDAERSIVILGTNALIPHLEKSGDFFTKLLTLNENLTLTILYESDTENFAQSLYLDTDFSFNRISYAQLKVHRDRISGKAHNKDDSILGDIKDALKLNNIGADDTKKLIKRIQLKQMNLRYPVNVIKADDRIWFCATTNISPTIDSYIEITKKDSRFGILYDNLLEYLDFLCDEKKGNIYLSSPGEELLELYDMDNYPRGIFPRKAFYTTKYQRYSIWGFVFNRKGEILLHKRSKTTKDNRLLWDKSIGGHVDLLDASTSITAKRELIEELFLPQAEFTKYIKQDIGDIIDFGDWNPQKKPEKIFRNSFVGIAPSDWILFRTTDIKGDPLTVRRMSPRRFHLSDTEVITKPTRFISDVYFFIAPPGYIDTHEQMKQLVELSEKTGAAEDHKLVSLEELRKWIEESEEQGKIYEIFTDDLIHINIEYRSLLEGFSEFIKYVFG